MPMVMGDGLRAMRRWSTADIPRITVPPSFPGFCIFCAASRDKSITARACALRACVRAFFWAHVLDGSWRHPAPNSTHWKHAVAAGPVSLTEPETGHWITSLTAARPACGGAQSRAHVWTAATAGYNRSARVPNAMCPAGYVAVACGRYPTGRTERCGFPWQLPALGCHLPLRPAHILTSRCDPVSPPLSATQTKEVCRNTIPTDAPRKQAVRSPDETLCKGAKMAPQPHNLPCLRGACEAVSQKKNSIEWALAAGL